MASTTQGLAVYLTPGMKVKLKAPISGPNSQGYFVRQEELPEEFWQNPDAVGPMIRGFVVENKAVGFIEASDQSEAGVIYTHEKPAPNSIWFFALTGERGLVKVISVPIHDHSTIVHGGPAYGTYFDDDSER